MLVVMWRIRYKLSLRDLVEMFAVRGYEFTHETVREWEARCAPELSQALKAKRRGQVGKSWYVDETGNCGVDEQAASYKGITSRTETYW